MSVTLAASFRAQVLQSIASRHLLDHPFYVAWRKGELSREQLKEYARQYYHYVLAEPTFLSAVHTHTPHFTADGKADLAPRQAILQNLMDEELGPENHPALWKRFAFALGLSEEELAGTSPLPSTADLTETFLDVCRNQPYYLGLAALHAFESQVPAIAAEKINGLRRFYGVMAPYDVAFFSVHEEADVFHSAAEWRLIEDAADTPEKREAVLSVTRTACEALWCFLDGVYAAA